METYNDWLMHFGRKGQKWGVMNGPPYPISDFKRERLKKKYAKLKDEEKTTKMRVKNAELNRAIKSAKYEQKKKDAELDQTIKKERYEQKRYGEELKRKELTPRQIKKLSNSRIRKMTNDELKSVLERQKMENELRAERYKNIGSGKGFVKEALLKFGTIAVTTAISTIAIQKGKEWSHKHFVNHPENYEMYISKIGDTLKKTIDKKNKQKGKSSFASSFIKLFDTSVDDGSSSGDKG